MVDRVKALLEERKQLERELANAKRQLALGGGACRGQRRSRGRRAGRAHRRQGQAAWRARSRASSRKDLRGLVDDGKKQIGSGVVAIVGVTEDGKANLTVGVTDDLTGRISAVDLIKAGAEALGGKGGGRQADFCPDRRRRTAPRPKPR